MTSPFRIPDAPKRTRYKTVLRGPRYKPQRYVIRILPDDMAPARPSEMSERRGRTPA